MQKRNKKSGRFETILKDRICIICGTMFHPRLKKRKTCSKKCGYKHRSRTYKPTKASLLKRSNSLKKVVRTKEWKDKISVALRGERNGSWRGGISYTRNTRRDRRHQKWRKEVFERDNYTCQNKKCKARCGNGKSVYLEAHHIKEFAYFKELRYEVSNGITLCRDCHKIETKKERKKNWRNQYSK